MFLGVVILLVLAWMRDEERRTVGEDRRLGAEQAAIREREVQAGGATGRGGGRRRCPTGRGRPGPGGRSPPDARLGLRRRRLHVGATPDRWSRVQPPWAIGPRAAWPDGDPRRALRIAAAGPRATRVPGALAPRRYPSGGIGASR